MALVLDLQYHLYLRPWPSYSLCSTACTSADKHPVALKGLVLQPAEGYVGAMLQDTKDADVADGEERRWMHRGTLEQITYWKHDNVPHKDDAIFKAMRWASVADTLHAELSDEEEAMEEA